MVRGFLTSVCLRLQLLFVPLLFIAVVLVPLPAPAVPSPTVTLNLKDADIGAVISTVAEITGKNFIVDPRVKAKVTVISSKPMNKDEVYQVFLSILDVHGFAVVPSGGVLKIVPDINAKQSAIPTLPDSRIAGTDMVATQIIPIHNVSAAQLVPILRPLVPQQGHLAAYPATNTLIISDRASNIERLVKIIQRIDQAGDNDVEVVPLQHASAADVARILTSLSKPGPGEAGTGMGTPNVIADERTNSILMSGDKSVRLAMRAIIAHLDTPMENTGNTRVIYLRYAKAKDLVAVLKGVGTSQGKGPAGLPGAAATAAPGGQQFDVQADEATNSVVITASPDIMRSLEEVIHQLDIRRAQVLVEAVIAEVSSNKAKDLGVQWVFDNAGNGKGPLGIINFSQGGASISSLAATALGAKSGTTTTSAPSVPDGATLGVGRFNKEGFSFAALLHALSSDGATNILSTPTLVTLDNEEAQIVIGQNVPFITGSFANTGTTGTTGAVTNPFQTIQRQDVGLTLKIKPQINEGDAIKLDINQEVSSLSPSVSGAADLITNKRSIKTSVLVDDGRLVVLGGLIEDNLQEKVAKVPLLGDIPLLGALFRDKNTTKTKTNLMVFIHPVILRDEALAAQYTTSKYNYIREKQIERQKQGVMLMPEEKQPEMLKLEEMMQHAAPPPAPDKAMLPSDKNKSASPPADERATPVPAPDGAH